MTISSKKTGPSRSETILQTLRLQIALEEIGRLKQPCIAKYEGLEIRNEAAVKAIALESELTKESLNRLYMELKEFRSLKIKKNNSFLRRFYEALELKPNVFDLKKLMGGDS